MHLLLYHPVANKLINNQVHPAASAEMRGSWGGFSSCSYKANNCRACKRKALQAPWRQTCQTLSPVTVTPFRQAWQLASYSTGVVCWSRGLLA